MATRIRRSSRRPAGATFSVEIDGVTAAVFREVSGLGLETELVEMREGSGGGIRKVPGLMKFPNIVLKRGYTGNNELYDWAASRTDRGDVTRRTVSITLTSGRRQIARWTVHRAWPVKWTGPSLNAAGTDVAMETVELAHEGITRDDDD